MIPGYVLAGGVSRRMGECKAFLLIDGAPMADRIARMLQQAGCAPVALVGRQPELVRLGWPVITEPAGLYHPLIGVWAALERSGQTLALFCPCDLPNLTAEAVGSLLAYGRPCRAAGQPLLCILDRTASIRARQHAERGGSVRDFVAQLPPVAVPEGTLLNLNTPEDLARIG